MYLITQLMSHKSLRGRIPSHRRTRPSQSQPSSSSRTLRRRVLVGRSPDKPVKAFKRCNSEPALLGHNVNIDGAAALDDHDRMIVQRPTCTEGFSLVKDLVLPYSPAKIEGYDKDGKVVVNVTVEGSPGPVRTMLKLGSSVEETMDIVKKQYNSEGRSPQLDQHSLSTFELHQSHFSLRCLDKSDMIGDIGGRSFYMRKSNNDNSSFNGSRVISSKGNESPSCNPVIVFPIFISNSFKKIMKFSNKLSKILGCIDR
ncbi:hypothetical protein M8C21_009723 [Ambrosia artemisiifolia]|uniref:DUF7054 domain-containing protein n=1 Tax=Ambrosia artemisiifolia TaxID=4212 RepID=A0AAD5GAD9_AMBAR|nr:hypothetical protein M8C21_009723 [Ambrosia artemisiifolia]